MINSPNYDYDGFPQIIMNKNTFLNNLGYLGAGAIFIRMAIWHSENITDICGGVTVTESTFSKNFGLKKSNAGAFNIYCDLVTGYNEDYFASSGIKNTTKMNDTYSMFLFNSLHHSLMYPSYYNGYNYSIFISNSSFTSNYAGFKGTALYIKYANQIVINSTTF